MPILTGSTPTKTLYMATQNLYFLTQSTKLSLTHFRHLSCTASATSQRLEPNPPDLISWVKKQGGFVHPSVRIAQNGQFGLGLVASDDIASGSYLIGLPDHVPLRFGLGDGGDGDNGDSVLVNVARKVPGIV